MPTENEPRNISVMNILLAEDDPELARMVSTWLSGAGHVVACESDGKAALRRALVHAFDAVILDVNLPGIDGFEIVKMMRGQDDLTPVLFLTARDSVTDRVRGLSSGGDDYLTKPFAMEELMARLEALVRRAAINPSKAPTRKLRNWTLDPLQRRLRDAGSYIELQPKEWTLLEVLMASEGRVLTKKFLLEKVWDIRFDPGTNVVDAMICRLRRKIDAPGAASHIQTVRGKGYVFKAVP